MSKFEEPEVTDPRTLVPGDQVGCHDTGRRPQPLVGAPEDEDFDVLWVSLLNAPGETTHVWDEPVRRTSVALQLSAQDWLIGAYPRMLARRRIP